MNKLEKKSTYILIFFLLTKWNYLNSKQAFQKEMNLYSETGSRLLVLRKVIRRINKYKWQKLKDFFFYNK